KPRDVLVLHIHFTSKTHAAGEGFLILLINMAAENLLYGDLAYPLSASQAKGLDVNMPPTVFGTTMNTVKGEIAERHRTTSRSNLSLLKSKLTTPLVRALISDYQTAQGERTNLRLAETLKEIYGEDFTVNHQARQYSAQSVEALLHGERREPTLEERAAALFEEPSAATTVSLPGDIPSTSPQEPLPKVVLICEPEISPFSGRAARQIAVGDEVVVKIKDGRESARYFSELLGGCVGDELVPLLAPVVKIDKGSDTFVEAFVEFGPGIFGEFFIPPEVKIKTKEEVQDIFDPFMDEASVFAEERFGRQIMSGLILLIVSTIVLIFIFWKFS
ncbi:MAG: hypothetical protein AB1546_10380, partial [bacterium]